jgi:putative membrane protein
MMYYHNGGMPYHHWFFGGLGMIVFWVVVILLIMWIVRGKKSHMWKHDHAMDILRERYAKGEIDKEEFESRKKSLE